MRNFTFLTLLASLLIVGCTEVTIEQSNPLTEINSLPDLTASFADEGETRTFVEDSKYLRWHEADLITAFFGNTLNRQYQFKGKTGDNSGTFSLVPNGELGTGNDLSSIYALYPYDENTTITDNGVISLTLPATQTYAENSFGKGANTMVAVTESAEDTFLSFKNACGYLKLKLYGDDVTIASIEVTGNNEEKIAGSATATMEFGGVPTIAMNDEATTSVTLDCDEGVAIGATADMATEFWIVLPETTFEGGITITATNTDGAVFSKSTTNTVAITRNDIQPMAALKAEFASKPANNEIWYTNGSTTKATAPYQTDVFGANIVSNTYDADKGCWIIEFDGEVSEIGSYAFRLCYSLTSVTIGNSVTSIGTQAFYNCTSLTSVTIGNSVTEIGQEAFRNCSSLTSVTIPDSVTSIGSSAFSECDSLTSITIPDSVTSIGSGAFHDCTSLTSATIPNSVTTIGSSAFKGCDSLTSVTIGNGVTEIGKDAFYNCTALTSITIPNSVTSIGDNTFYDCTSLTSVTIPDSVTSIGSGAFSGCDLLESVTIGNGVTEIGGSAFTWCTSLTSVTIPDSVTSIGSSAFYYCRSLTSVTIGNSVTEIGQEAFRNCSSLTSVTIPDSVTSIGRSAFYNCDSLTSVTIPDSVTEIGQEAFRDCSSLTSVIIGNGVTTIGDSAFSYSISLTSFTIPDSVTEIGDNAFYNCTSLTSATIPDSVTSIGSSAFYYCYSLESVYCKPTTPPAGGYSMFKSNASGRKIYVPAASVEAYKSAARWSDYASDIVDYVF